LWLHFEAPSPEIAGTTRLESIATNPTNQMEPPPNSDLARRSLDASFWDDASLVGTLLKDPTITQSTAAAWTEGGGLSGDSRIVTIARSRGDGVETTKYFLKLTKPAGLESSRANGLAREGVFLALLKDLPVLAPHVAATLYAHGDMQESRKVILTELVDGVQAGYWFGPYSPHNWSKDLTALTAPCPGIDEAAIVHAAFRIAASIHAAYWNNPSLLTDLRFASLRCREWVPGGNRPSWEAGVKFSRDLWEKVKPVSSQAGLASHGQIGDSLCYCAVRTRPILERCSVCASSGA
jgi:hypothetical protein